MAYDRKIKRGANPDTAWYPHAFGKATPLEAMARTRAANVKKATGNGPAVGLEAKLCRTAGTVRNNMDAAANLHVHPGLHDRRSRT